jgi:ParB-like nuclease domain
MEAKHSSDAQSIPAAELKRSTRSIPVDQIDVDVKRFRKVSDEDINKIAGSIRKIGLLEPIGVRIINFDKDNSGNARLGWDGRGMVREGATRLGCAL